MRGKKERCIQGSDIGACGLIFEMFGYEFRVFEKGVP